jgi:hypothetical protein
MDLVVPVDETVVSVDETVKSSLEEEFWVLKSKIMEITNQKAELDKLRIETSKKLESIQNVIDANNLEMLSKNMVDDISSLPGFELISKDELLIIAKGIDKTDYTSHGKPRWMDLESVTKKVIVIKTQYPTWKLTNLYKTKLGQPNLTPPNNIYEFSYTDGNNRFTTL